MRKFSKILTVFLTVCLLAGVVTATVASADGTSMIDTIGADKNNGLADTVARGRHTAASINNTYTRYTRNSDSNTAAETTSFTFASDTNYDQYKYVVFDLDFMSDAYSTGTTLAYMDKIRFTWSQNTAGKCYIVTDGTDWYASTNNAYDDTDIPLEKELGVWNHLTQVVDIDKNLSYIFINGQFLLSSTNSKTISVNTSNFNFVVDKNLSGNFSIGIDNVIARGYAKNYVKGGNIGYSITDYFGAATVDTSLPIYMCDDVTYNLNYSYDSGDKVVASISQSEVTKNYYIWDIALEYLNTLSGDVTLTTRKSIENFEIPEAIDTLTVVCTNGATFSRTGSYAVSKTDEGDTTTYVAEKAKTVNALWLDGDGKTLSNEPLYVVLKTNAVYIPDEIADVYSTIKGTGKYEWSLDGGKYDEFIPGSQLPDGVTEITFRPTPTATVTWQNIDGNNTNKDEKWFKGSVLVCPEDAYAYIKGTPKYEWSVNGSDYSELVLNDSHISDEATEISIRPVTATVTWNGVEGISADDVVEIWFKDSVLAAGDLTKFSSYEENDGNGWYILKYTAWAGFAAGMKVVDDEYTFTPELTPVASLSDIKLNMSLLTKFEANLFISEGPSNVNVIGLYINEDCVDNIFETLESVEIDGAFYLLHSFFFDNSDVDKVISRYVEYEVEYEGRKTVVIDEVEVSLLDYAQKVLDQYGCGSEEANLAYNLINYANAAYALKTGTDYEDAIAFLALEGHEDGCACNATYNYAGEEVYYDFECVLGENVYAVSFDVSNEQPSFVVYVMIDEFGNALADVRLDFNGIFGTEVGDVALNLVRGDDITIEGVGTFATLFFEDMPLYNATEIFTITVTDATTGEIYVCNYSLATYIDYFSIEGVDADSRGLAVAKALYSFAKVAKDYKLN